MYEGTDTRACGLLIGAALAMVWPTRRPAVGGKSADRRVPTAVRRLLDAAGIAGLAVIGLLVWRTNQYSDFMFRGGLVVLSLATAAAVAAVVTPGSLLGRALGWAAALDRRPVLGIYLWHYPIIVLTAGAGAAGSPVSPGRAIAVVAGTVAGPRCPGDGRGPIRRGARLRWVTPDKATETSEATATGGGDMTGEPDRNKAGGGRRPSWLRRPRALAAGDRRAVPARRRRTRRGRDRVHAADLGDRGPRGAAAVGHGLAGERAAVQLGRRAWRRREPGQARRRAPPGQRRQARQGRRGDRAPAHSRRHRDRGSGRGRARAADAAAADLVHVRGAHRRLHVGGADLRRTTSRTRPTGSRPATPTSASSTRS